MALIEYSEHREGGREMARLGKMYRRPEQDLTALPEWGNYDALVGVFCDPVWLASQMVEIAERLALMAPAYDAQQYWYGQARIQRGALR
jgi:hypothetical protein